MIVVLHAVSLALWLVLAAADGGTRSAPPGNLVTVPAAVIIVPSAVAAKPSARTGKLASANGLWARGGARLVAHATSPLVSTIAFLPMVEVGGALGYAVGTTPIDASGVAKLMAAHHPRHVASLHASVDDDRIIVFDLAVWTEGGDKPVFVRSYVQRLDKVGTALDQLLADLVRNVEPKLDARRLKPRAGIWSHTSNPAALESYLAFLDLRALQAAARGRPLSGKPRPLLDLLKESLAADPDFKPAGDMLANPSAKLDRALISETRLPP